MGIPQWCMIGVFVFGAFVGVRDSRNCRTAQDAAIELVAVFIVIAGIAALLAWGGFWH